MSKHFSRLKDLHKKSAAALSVFHSTKNALEKTNAELDNVIESIETEMSSLTDAWREAKTKKSENAEVVRKIGELIQG